MKAMAAETREAVVLPAIDAVSTNAAAFRETIARVEVVLEDFAIALSTSAARYGDRRGRQRRSLRLTSP